MTKGSRIIKVLLLLFISFFNTVVVPLLGASTYTFTGRKLVPTYNNNVRLISNTIEVCVVIYVGNGRLINFVVILLLIDIISFPLSKLKVCA